MFTILCTIYLFTAEKINMNFYEAISHNDTIYLNVCEKPELSLFDIFKRP